MSRDGSGVYTVVPASVAVTSTVIASAPYNTQLSDLAAAVNDTVLLNGIKPFTGPQSMGSQKITSLAAGTVAADAVNYGQVAKLAVANIFTAAQTYSNQMLFTETALTVSAGRASWDMSTSGPDVLVIVPASSLQMDNPAFVPANGARGTIRLNNTSGANRAITWSLSFSVLTGVLPATILLGEQMTLRYWTAASVIYIVAIDRLSDFNAGIAFTPALKFGGANVGMTGTFTGLYWKIGPSLIFYYIRITLTVKGTSPGAATITGLPFTTTQTTQFPISFYANMAGIVTAGAYGGTTITLTNGGAVSSANMTDANFTATSDFIVSGVVPI